MINGYILWYRSIIYRYICGIRVVERRCAGYVRAVVRAGRYESLPVIRLHINWILRFYGLLVRSLLVRSLLVLVLLVLVLLVRTLPVVQILRNGYRRTGAAERQQRLRILLRRRFLGIVVHVVTVLRILVLVSDGVGNLIFAVYRPQFRLFVSGYFRYRGHVRRSERIRIQRASHSVVFVTSLNLVGRGSIILIK